MGKRKYKNPPIMEVVNAAISNESIKKIEVVFGSIRTLYNVDIIDNYEITEYLLKFPDLINLLAPMSEQLRKIFGKDAQIILKMYHDPEIVYEYLSIYLRLNDYSGDFMDKIEAIHEPFDAQMAKTEGWLQITTDFFPPEK